jgi:hypothetical protein
MSDLHCSIALDLRGGDVTALQLRLYRAFPHLTFRTRAILDALLLTSAGIGSAGRVARLVGLPSRFALGRMMRREGLPGLRELADWVSVLEWVSAAERTKASLFALATRSHKSPAVAYRVVKRLTGLTWAQLKARGSPWLLRLFVGRCQALCSKSLCGPSLRCSSGNHLLHRHHRFANAVALFIFALTRSRGSRPISTPSPLGAWLGVAGGVRRPSEASIRALPEHVTPGRS